MVIDERKVNLAEADIEQWLWENPGRVKFEAWDRQYMIDRWIGRQVTVPSGVIDLVGATQSGLIAIVEVKNVPIQSSALAQVRRYTYDFTRILDEAGDLIGEHRRPIVRPVVIGRQIDPVVMREAEALDVQIVTFGVHLYLQVTGPLQWSEKFLDERSMEWKELAKGSTFLQAINGYASYRRDVEADIEEGSDEEADYDSIDRLDFVI